VWRLVVITQILTTPGVVRVGPLPPEVQSFWLRLYQQKLPIASAIVLAARSLRQAGVL
jgi:hypothetical protein